MWVVSISRCFDLIASSNLLLSGVEIHFALLFFNFNWGFGEGSRFFEREIRGRINPSLGRRDKKLSDPSCELCVFCVACYDFILFFITGSSAIMCQKL